MPSLEDWLNNPLDIIQSLYEQKDGKEHSKLVEDYFTEKLKDSKAISWVPSMNDTPLHNLKAETLVRFRCMIQDMYDPEFYLGVYELKDTKSGQTRLKCGKYIDVAQCGPSQELCLESSQNVTMDRQTLYCVPIPGEADWVKSAYSELSQAKVSACNSQSTDRVKRGRDLEMEQEGDSMSATSSTPVEPSDGMDTGEGNSAESKRTRTDRQTGSVIPVQTDLNFPLKDEKGPACLVKVYNGFEKFKVNDVVEFIGVLSVDPALATFDNSEESGMIDIPMTSAEERSAHAPPPSLVPRLHSVLAHKLTHNNPHLENSGVENKSVIEELQKTASSLRCQLLTILQHSLLGDAVAAEYILCHLLSSVYGRVDVMPLGKFSVNLSGCPKGSRTFPQLFYHLISNLVTTSAKLSMTLSEMNESKFSPEKDYNANRLKSGLLQLGPDTHLVLDETVLEAGQLDAKGVQNVTALGNLITWQKVEYDFCYHKQDFTTDVAVLTLSEGKSLLPSDCHIPLCSETVPDDLRTYYTQLDNLLSPENLRKLRLYITAVKQIEYNMGDDMQKKIQDDFVEIRKEDPKSMTVEDFHSLLNLVRLLSLSFGLNSTNMEMWNKAKAMEAMRKQRLSQLLASPVPQQAQ